MNYRVFRNLFIGVFVFLSPTISHARCKEASPYQIEYEIISCQPANTIGVTVKVNILSKKLSKKAGEQSYEWWPDKESLPKVMEVFFEPTGGASCSTLPLKTKRTGTLRELCCDGGEPRCDFSSVQLFELGE